MEVLYNGIYCDEESSKEGKRKDKEILQLLDASRNELKVAKLEIDSLFICEKIPRKITIIGFILGGGSAALKKFYFEILFWP